jgi:hypothetical protein
MLLRAGFDNVNVTAMTARTNPLPYHQDHLALIDDMIAAKEAAVSRQRETMRALLREGQDVVAEANAMRSHAEALKRLQSDRLATLNLINRLTGERG